MYGTIKGYCRCLLTTIKNYVVFRHYSWWFWSLSKSVTQGKVAIKHDYCCDLCMTFSRKEIQNVQFFKIMKLVSFRTLESINFPTVLNFSESDPLCCSSTSITRDWDKVKDLGSFFYPRNFASNTIELTVCFIEETLFMAFFRPN